LRVPVACAVGEPADADDALADEVPAARAAATVPPATPRNSRRFECNQACF